MLSKWLLISLLALGIQNTFAGNYIRNYIPDVTKFNTVFYNPNTQLALQGVLENVGRDPFPGIGFRGIDCSCDHRSRSFVCCSGINITQIKFDHQACVNMTVIEEESTLKLNFTINRNEIFNGNISAKNPPPLCVPIYTPILTFCVHVFDIYKKGSNLHACVDLQTKVFLWPILTLHFDCVKVPLPNMGIVPWMKPENNSSLPQIAQLAVIMPEVIGPEIYDPVDFEPESPEFLNNHTSSLTPEEEDNIGQLKL